MRSALFIALTALSLAGCSGAAKTADPAPLVRVFEVGSDAEPFGGQTLTGTVAARIESVLGFREGGRIVERRVDNGAIVARGALLARIDPVDLGEAMAAARAQAVAARRRVDAARATADRSAADERRLRGLADSGAIAGKDYDAALEGAQAATARLASARADVAAAEASARVQGNRRGYAELRAPTSGVITAVLAEPGQVVAAGTPVLRFAEAGPREVMVDVPEQMRGSVPRTATGTLYGGGEFGLTLRELAAAADPTTRTYRARYRVEVAAPPLGATVTLRFAGQTAPSASMIPLGAVTERGGGPGVWIVGREGKVAWRRVGVAAMNGERAAVSDLRPGELIVALGAHMLQSGQAVRIASDKPLGRTAAR